MEERERETERCREREEERETKRGRERDCLASPETEKRLQVTD
jgi:hypothetical protein